MRSTIRIAVLGTLCVSMAIGASGQGIPRAEIKLDDSFILGVRARVDQEEIESARWATTHASSNEVRQFAQSLLRGHSSAQNAALRLAVQLKTELKITGDTDQAISRRQVASQAALHVLKGKYFDRAFLTAVRDEHASEIDKVNRWYAEVADNDSVKAYLKEIMPTLVKHQQTAERLLAKTGTTIAAR